MSGFIFFRSFIKPFFRLTIPFTFHDTIFIKSTPLLEQSLSQYVWYFQLFHSLQKMRLKLSNAIKLTRHFQEKHKKALDKNEKMCGKALKTRLIFRGRAHEIHS